MKYIIISICLFYCNTLKAQFPPKNYTDSVYVRIDKIDPKLRVYSVIDGKLVFTFIIKKNYYGERIEFQGNPQLYKLISLPKKNIPEKKIISIDEYVELTNKYTYYYLSKFYKVYIIILEGREEFVVQQVLHTNMEFRDE